ncbi:Rhodopsin, GQ-coupled [Orchesella cincta]|uniref:Rhodopsin, GQ-coupled n=1 Tax=Orchesella cincta TaxID=48709 RepID=A0A1D2MHV1_ORCCI|nr:Rhodopsin, GQ-coupled [Orchesella cincta]
MDQNTDEFLPEMLTCQIMDLDQQRTCSEDDPSICIICSILGKFITGESIYEVGATGHMVCVVLWGLTIIIGLLGVFTNFLIVIVIRRMNSQRPFDILIMFLAGFDLLCCGSSLIGTTMHVALYQFWVSRDFATMQWFHKSTLVTLFGRTTSTYMAMLITLERFLVITFPIQTKQWFTSRKTTIMAVAVILVSILLNTPRFLMFEVVQKDDRYANITALQDFTYIIGVTHMFGWNTLCLFLEKFGDANEHLDFLAPLPVLLVLSILSYYEGSEIAKQTKAVGHEAEDRNRGGEAFLPVVIAYFSTNIVPFVHFFVAYFTDTFYRELNIAVGLSIVVNAARPAFKKETKALGAKWYNFVLGQNETNAYRVNNVNTGTGSSSGNI